MWGPVLVALVVWLWLLWRAGGPGECRWRRRS